jgi:hypothetical protein
VGQTRGIGRCVNSRRQIEIDLRRWLGTHHSVIGYTESLRLGATAGIVQSKNKRGEWERLYLGVYRDTAAPTGPHQDLRAACVATSGFGVASHASAAWLWGLLPTPPETPEVTVRVGSGGTRSGSRLVVHRSTDLEMAAAVHRDAIPVTNPLRTLVDIAGVAVPRDLTTAVDNALSRRLVTIAGLEAEMNRLSRPGRGGVGALRRHLLDYGYTGGPEPSVLEAHTRRLIARTGLPLPSVECRAGEDGEYRLDLAWAAILFAVEVDGYLWHFSPAHKERDESRRNHLRALGWTVLVYSWRPILRDSHMVACEVMDMYRRLSRPG